MVSEYATRSRQEIWKLRENVIGLLKLNQSDSHYELVVADYGTKLDTICFTQFGAIQESFQVPTNFGTYRRFPDGKNMIEMLSEPFEWDKFLKSF